MPTAAAPKQPSVTLAELKEGAPAPLPVKVGDTIIGYIEAREFSTGSYGFGLNGKADIPLGNGKTAKVQVSMNLTVLHSKNRSDTN